VLPYTAESLFTSFAQYHAGIWPLPPVALALALAAVLLTLRPVPGGPRIAAAILAAGWLWTGIGYQILFFARYNFVAPLYGALFVVQGLLLLWAAARDRLAFRFDGATPGWIGLALAVIALAWPLIDRLSGQPWMADRIAGLAPTPTVVLTFALLLLASRPPVHLAIIPLLWSLVAGATAWILWIPQDLLLPVIGAFGSGLILWKRCRYSA